MAGIALAPVSHAWQISRRYVPGLLIALAALESALEVALRDDPVAAPRSSMWFAAPAAAVIVLSLLAYRRFPFAAPAGVLVLGAGLSFVDGRLVVFPAGVFAAGMAAALLLGMLADPHRAQLGLAVLVAGATIIVSNDPRRTTGEFVSIPALLAVGWAAGRTLRERGEQARAADVRAARAERERQTAARIGIAEERARIARELHDIVAHSVSVMVLQAGAVRHKLPASLAQETEALKTSRRPGAPRSPRCGGSSARCVRTATVPRSPRSRASGSLDALFAQVRRAGLPVELHVEGDPLPLPPAIDLSAYRIVQEGLTNALKHAGASRADVEVRYGPGDVSIEVRDDGTRARRRRRARPRPRRHRRAGQALRRRDGRRRARTAAASS